MIVNTKDINVYLTEIQRGDKSQMTPLFEATANHLKGVARYYLANKSLADDVVSTSYMHVLEYISSYDPEQSGYNWLCKIVQNNAYSLNVKERRIHEAEMRAIERRLTEHYDQNYDYKLDFDEFLRSQKDQVDKMIAFRRYYLGETLEQIGAFIDMSKAAVHKRVTNILKILEKNQKKVNKSLLR